MVTTQKVLSGFSVDDLAKAKDFYLNKMGLKLSDETMGLQIMLPGGWIDVYL